MKFKLLWSLMLFITIMFSNLCYSLNVTDEPYMKGSVLAQRYQDIISHYKNSGLKTARYIETENFPQFFSMAKANQFDIVFASNVNARILIEQYQYIPILVRNSGFNAVLVTGVDSGISSVNDLAGQKVFSPTVFDPSSYIGQNSVKGVALDIVELSEISKVIMKVISGEGKAGFIADIDIRHLASSLRDKLKILLTSEKTFTSYVLVSRQNIEMIETIKKVIASYYTSPHKKVVENKWGKFEYIELDEASLADLFDSDNDEVMKTILELLIRQ